MTKQKAIYHFPSESEIPIELLKVVGLITIRFGQLGRLLMNVYCRMLEPQRDVLDVIAELKNQFKTLAKRIEHIEQEFNNKSVSVPGWLNFNNLVALAGERNAIHDALFVNEEGGLFWLSSSKNRQHKQVNLSDLKDLSDRLNNTLLQINANSLTEKNPALRNEAAG